MTLTYPTYKIVQQIKNRIYVYFTFTLKFYGIETRQIKNTVKYI